MLKYITIHVEYCDLLTFMVKLESFSEILEYLFALQANTEEELPEKLLGTVRISNLDPQKAVLPPPES